jgi:hypothetical protein
MPPLRARARLSLLAILASAPAALAALELPQVFADNCVLQTNREYGARSYVFGYADAGDAISVALVDSASQKPLGVYNTSAAPDGSWQVTLNPLSDTLPPFDIVVDDLTSAEHFAAHGCVAGDVYVASGQSNQCFSAEDSFDADALWNASWPNIRLFAVPMIQAASPQRRLPPVTPSSQCSWNHDKSPPPPNQTAYACNVWMASQPATNRYFSAVALFTALEVARLHTGSRNIGIIYSAFGGTSISLWAPPAAYAGCPAETPVGGGLWNAMIAPVARFSLRSFLFFQGENDVSTEASTPGWYACRFNRLIAHWRAAWAMGDVAFNFVQLGPVADAGPPYGFVRAAQTLALPRPNGTTDISGMAVAYDLGDASSPYDSVHFRNKVAVGRRLAAAVLRTQFALQNASLRGPELAGFSQASAAGVTIDIFVADGSAVELVDGGQCSLCCAGARDTVELSFDGGQSWCNSTLAVSASGASVVATAVAGCSNPSARACTHARLAWGSYPQCAIAAAGNGFPLAAFSLPVAAPAGGQPPAAAAEAAEAAVASAPQRGGSLTWRGQSYAWTGATPPPPLGINTWNAFHVNIDENIVIALADAFVSLGLKELGYSFVNIDDGQVRRAEPSPNSPSPRPAPSD